MKMKPLLQKATIADVNAIANVYLRSRKELVTFAPLKHTDESIHHWKCTTKKDGCTYPSKLTCVQDSY